MVEGIFWCRWGTRLSLLMLDPHRWMIRLMLDLQYLFDFLFELHCHCVYLLFFVTEEQGILLTLTYSCLEKAEMIARNTFPQTSTFTGPWVWGGAPVLINRRTKCLNRGPSGTILSQFKWHLAWYLSGEWILTDPPFSQKANNCAQSLKMSC